MSVIASRVRLRSASAAARVAPSQQSASIRMAISRVDGFLPS